MCYTPPASIPELPATLREQLLAHGHQHVEQPLAICRVTHGRYAPTACFDSSEEEIARLEKLPQYCVTIPSPESPPSGLDGWEVDHG